MKKSLIALVLTGLLSASLLAGCGEQFDDTSRDITKINVDKYVTSIGDYSSLNVVVDPHDLISDEDVQGYIDYVLGTQAETVKSDRTVVEVGDIVNIDYVGVKDGVEFAGGADTGFDLTIGSGTFIEGFEEGLIGHKVGEEVALDLTFPENYGAADLAGQAVVFNVKINYISENKIPELTDEMVKGFELENVSNIEEYRAFVLDGLQTSADESYLNQKRDAVQQALAEKCTFADFTSLGLYQYYLDQLKNQAQASADNYGVSVEEMITGLYGMNYEDYEASLNEQASNLVKGALACMKVARAEKITISNDEVEQQLAIDAEDYGYANADEFKAAIDIDDYRNYLIQMKVVDKLLETAVVTETEEE